MSVENKAIIRRWIEARNTNNLEAGLALFVDEWHERLTKAFNGITHAFPDVHITEEAMIAEGKDVVLLWTFRGTHLGTFRGIPATGKKIRWTGVDIYTVVDGKIAQSRRESDMLNLMQQLGAVQEVADPKAKP
jgi:steroid delta-isomerase-like uncharacterized protein